VTSFCRGERIVPVFPPAKGEKRKKRSQHVPFFTDRKKRGGGAARHEGGGKGITRARSEDSPILLVGERPGSHCLDPSRCVGGPKDFPLSPRGKRGKGRNSRNLLFLRRMGGKDKTLERHGASREYSTAWSRRGLGHTGQRERKKEEGGGIPSPLPV